MAVADITSLDYLGKYVSFLTESPFEIRGVISAVIFHMDGSIQFSISLDDFYSFSDVRNLKILGEIKLY
jgi:hypothetical protein